MTEEQRLFLALVLRSHHNWTIDQLDMLRKGCEANDMISQHADLTDILSSYSLYCLNCGELIARESGAYPSSLIRCESCKFTKPLRWHGDYVHAGQAKLEFIDRVFFWPNIYTRDLYINEVLEHLHTLEQGNEQ